MKYKYIVGLLVALILNNAFAADMEERYQGVYETLTSKLTASQRISGALDDNQTYDNKKDTNLCRSILAGFQLRKAVFSLDATELETIVKANNAFFKTSLGMSLVYGWTLQHFAAPEIRYYPQLRYYIVGNFSFGQHFNLIADKFPTEQTKTFLKITFTNGLAAVDDDEDTKWEFYSNAISALCVVESIGSSDCTLSMDGIIEGSYLTKEKAAQSVPEIVINDTNSLDDIASARHLETELEESIVRTYYDVIKDQFSGEFVSGENMKKLQYLVDLIIVGTNKECTVLRAIPVEENKVFSLNARLIGTSGNILGFDAVQELKTLGELCNYLLGVYAKQKEDKILQFKKDVDTALRPLFVAPTKTGEKWRLQIPKNLKNVSTLKKIVDDHPELAINAVDLKALGKFKENVQVNSNSLKTLTKDGVVLSRIISALTPLVMDADYYK
jgi:hypothetical protein